MEAKQALALIESRCEPEPNTGCMLWTGSLGHRCYGQVSYKKKRHLVHRLVWKLIHGDIPTHIFVCHKCDTPLCCNPDHLFAGDHAANMADMIRKGRLSRHTRAQGEKHGASKITADQVLAIRADPRKYADIASDYGLSRHYIGNIKTRYVWKHLP